LFFKNQVHTEGAQMWLGAQRNVTRHENFREEKNLSACRNGSKKKVQLPEAV
jgi:hypothetical protein